MMNFFYNLFARRSDENEQVMERPSHSRGFEGDLNVEAAIAFEDEQIILALDYDFAEAPSYVEFDLDKRHIRIVQQTGDVATLAQLAVPMQEENRIRQASKIALVTGTGEEKLLQVLALMVRPRVRRAGPHSRAA